MNNLWMRWLDFRRLRDLFCVIADHDCLLRAKDLSELGVSERILVNDKGMPFKPTPIYHYRRTIERLGMVRIYQKRYCVQRENPNVNTILALKNRGQPLSAKEKEALSTLILQNNDCFNAFLLAFVGPREHPTDIDHFIRIARPITIKVNAKTTDIEISMQNMESTFELHFSGENAIQAILWGLKAWCVDQLQFLDEVFSGQSGYTLYPRDIEVPPLGTIAEKVLQLLDFKSEWALIRVEEIIWLAGIRCHLPAEAIQQTLHLLLNKFPEFVAPVSTSEHFILNGVHPSQRKAKLNSYLRLTTGEIVSHLRIHSGITKALRDKELL